MSEIEEIQEDQPTPEEIALAKKREYFRNYARERRKNNPEVRAKEAAYSKEYMRTYSKTPEFKAKHGEKKRQSLRDKRAIEKERLEQLKEKNPMAYEATVDATRMKNAEYHREYSARPEVKERRKEQAAAKPEEEKARVWAEGRERLRISKLAKASGTDTATVRAVLAALEKGDKAA